MRLLVTERENNQIVTQEPIAPSSTEKAQAQPERLGWSDLYAADMERDRQDDPEVRGRSRCWFQVEA